MANVETLILAQNKLESLNESLNIFSNMNNFKLLNLSYNSIKFIQTFQFSELFKLEIIDLSFNKIYSLSDHSFNKLNSLREIYLNDNQNNFEIDHLSFCELESIHIVYISENILKNNATKSVFIDLFLNYCETKG